MITKSVAIVGNCQAEMLAGIFKIAAPGVVIRRLPPIFQMTNQDRGAVLTTLKEADYIFLQRVAEDHVLEWIRPSWLRSEFPGRTVVWPNIYFDGYFPDVQYVHLLHFGKLQGPLDEYHLMRVFRAYKAGRSVHQAAQAVASGEHELDDNAFSSSLNRLLLKEQDVDVMISDFVAKEASLRRSFYTPNHPYLFVLIEMARRLAERGNLPFQTGAAAQFKYHLDAIFIPAYSALIQKQCTWVEETVIYRGVRVDAATQKFVTVGKPRYYTTVDLVTEFYRVYDVTVPGD